MARLRFLTPHYDWKVQEVHLFLLLIISDMSFCNSGTDTKHFTRLLYRVQNKHGHFLLCSFHFLMLPQLCFTCMNAGMFVCFASWQNKECVCSVKKETHQKVYLVQGCAVDLPWHTCIVCFPVDVQFAAALQKDLEVLRQMWWQGLLWLGFLLLVTNLVFQAALPVNGVQGSSLLIE